MAKNHEKNSNHIASVNSLPCLHLQNGCTPIVWVCKIDHTSTMRQLITTEQPQSQPLMSWHCHFVLLSVVIVCLLLLFACHCHLLIVGVCLMLLLFHSSSKLLTWKLILKGIHFIIFFRREWCLDPSWCHHWDNATLCLVNYICDMPTHKTVQIQVHFSISWISPPSHQGKIMQQ